MSTISPEIIYSASSSDMNISLHDDISLMWVLDLSGQRDLAFNINMQTSELSCPASAKHDGSTSIKWNNDNKAILEAKCNYEGSLGGDGADLLASTLGLSDLTVPETKAEWDVVHLPSELTKSYSKEQMDNSLSLIRSAAASKDLRNIAVSSIE